MKAPEQPTKALKAVVPNYDECLCPMEVWFSELCVHCQLLALVEKAEELVREGVKILKEEKCS